MNPKVSRGPVAQVLRVVRVRARRAAAIATALWAAVVVAGAIGVAWLWSGPEGWAQGSIGPVTVVAGAFILLGAGAIWAHLAVGRWLSDRKVASEVEQRVGLEDGVVLGSLELEESVPVGVSASLATRARGHVLSRLAGAPEDLADGLVDTARGWGRPALRTGLALLGLLAVASMVSPERTRSTLGGLLSPLEILARPIYPPLQVLPGDAQVPRGDEVEVLVVAGGRREVVVHWQATGDISREQVIPVDADSARLVLPPIDAPVAYWVEAPDGARSEDFRIDPTDPLFVGSVSVELVFPAYTGRFREEYRGDVPQLVVPQGTAFDIRGEANRPLQDVRLLGEDGSEFQLPLSEGGFEGRFTPPYDGEWRWRILGADGTVPARPPTALQVTVIPDSVPAIGFTLPARDTVLPLDMRQMLEIQARDDYGLREVRLVVRRLGAVGEAGEPVVERWAGEGTRGTLLRPQLDLSDWNLLPGDSIGYHAEAVEVGPFAKQATTREWILRVPEADDLRRDAADRLEDASNRVDSLIQDAQRLADELRDKERQAEADERRAEANRTAAEETTDAFERREEISEALDRQEDILASTDSLRAELDEMAEALREAGVSDPDLREDLAELEQLLAEVGDEAMRERMDELRSELGEMDPEGSREALEQMAEDQDRIRERLEESLEEFRRAAVEQDFSATNEEANELAREERRLAEALEQGMDPEAAAQRQDEAASRAEDLDERMERLAERLRELGEEATSDQVQEVQESVQKAGDAMQRSAQAAREGDRQEAAEAAEEASEEMDEAAKEMEQARQEMEEARQEAFRQAAEKAAEDALALARRQSDLRDVMGATSDPQIRADEGALLSGLSRLAEHLAVAAGAAGADPRGILEEVGKAMERIDAVVGTLDGPPSQRTGARAGADAAVTALNGIALAALEMAEGSAEGGASEGESEGELSEQLQQAADQQAQVTRQTEQAMSMQQQNQGQSSEMREVAEAQRRIAGELGRMADEPGNAEQTLGDLPALAEAARQLAEDLESGRLPPETTERQRELFHRLLDAGRSLEKDEESEERESEQAESFDRDPVGALGEDALRAFQFAPPGADVLRQLPPAQRNLILEYFDRLNRARVGGGGG